MNDLERLRHARQLLSLAKLLLDDVRIGMPAQSVLRDIDRAHFAELDIFMAKEISYRKEELS